MITQPSVQTQSAEISAEILKKLILDKDLRGLSHADKIRFHNEICKTLGLNPLTGPFDFMKNKKTGAETLYANKDCAAQLRKRDQISLTIPARELIGEVYVVTARAQTPDNRCDDATGCVSITGLRGEDLANAYMKAETKAKRRVTLSLCGLGFLDESEVESVPGLERQNFKAQIEPSAKVVAQIEPNLQLKAQIDTRAQVEPPKLDRVGISFKQGNRVKAIATANRVSEAALMRYITFNLKRESLLHISRSEFDDLCENLLPNGMLT